MPAKKMTPREKFNFYTGRRCHKVTLQKLAKEFGISYPTAQKREKEDWVTELDAVISPVIEAIARAHFLGHLTDEGVEAEN